MNRRFTSHFEPFHAYSEFDETLDLIGEYDEASESFAPELGESWLDELNESRATRSIPRLMKKPETDPPAVTLYVGIDLKIIHRDGTKGTAPMTGIFVPANYRPKPTVDLILYLHGHKGAYPGAHIPIDGYWSSRRPPSYFPLRKELNASNKNVILVAPTLGPKSEYGLLTRPTRFNQYLDEVMAALRAHGPHKAQAQSPVVGKIILACHSGGGSPMLRLAKLKGSGGFADKVIECWGFDCLYGIGVDAAWANWARSHSHAKLFIYYLGSTESNSKKLRAKNLHNVFVERSSARGHYWVPKAHWRHRIQQARFLLNR